MMKKYFFALVLLTGAALGMVCRGDRIVQSAGKESAPEPNKTRLQQAYGTLPLRFEANQGQADKQVKFLARGQGYNLFLTATGAVLRLQTPHCEGTETCQPVASVLRMKFRADKLPKSPRS